MVEGQANESAVTLDDVQVEQAILLAFHRVAAVRQEVLSLTGPEPGSALFGDDNRADPYRVSHTAIQQLAVATEHLDALRLLTVEAGVLHPSPPFTLARAAIETAATVVWALSPGDSTERVVRAMRLQVQDAIDQDEAVRCMGQQPSPTLEDRRAKFDAVVRRVTEDQERRAKPQSITKVIEVADGVVASGVGTVMPWRVCSGFAHGRLWATIGVLENERLPGAPPGEARLMVTNSLDRVLWVVLAALDAADCALKLYSRLSTSVYCSPAAT